MEQSGSFVPAPDIAPKADIRPVLLNGTLKPCDVPFTSLLNTKKTRKNVQAALDAIDGYLGERATTLFAPVLDHLSEVGDTRSCTDLEDYFARNFDVGHVTTACEYLADLGLLGKASVSVRLTKRSNIDVQELAFFALTS